MHTVICEKCGQSFDRDMYEALPSPTHKRRYIHSNCENPVPTELKLKKDKGETRTKAKEDRDPDWVELEAYIMKLLKISDLNVRIYQQLLDYRKKYALTDKDMLLTLKYFYDIKGNSVNKANKGLGIIPYVYDDAKKYFENIDSLEESTDKILKEEPFGDVEVVHIVTPKAKKKRYRLFNFLDKDEVNGV